MLDLFFKGGPLMWPILACSITALAVTLHKGVQYTLVFRQLRGRAEEIRKRRPWFLVPLLKALGDGAGERELSLIGTRQVRLLERGLGLLSLITVISPILGLTGTVTGMIATFQVIGAGTGGVDPSLLATGIWEALITTAAGLLVAVPAHVASHILDERLSEIALSLQEVVLSLRNGGSDAV
ncbi:MAG: MotA/TolQ/ExbB proton channel family protein [Desulfohalobiaceae bacterium]